MWLFKQVAAMAILFKDMIRVINYSLEMTVG